MRFSASVSAVALLAGAAIGFAGPANADDFAGTFLHTAPGLQSVWTVSSCGAGCAHVADSTGWSADAHPMDGLWTFVVNLPYGTKCNNDGTAPGTVTYKVDVPAQNGTFYNSDAAPCQLAPGWSQPVYFSLTRI
jgi:hypothetical protein